MKREIKFRGKRTKTGKFVYGYYVYAFDICYNSQGYDDVPPRVHYIFDNRGNFYEVDPETVGQYTGLKDRNGKEIYEGDIGEGEHAIYLISWDEEKAQYKVKIIKTKSVLTKHCSFPLWQYVEDDGKCRFEVIGNRWDNPDLLEGEKI